MAIEAIIDQLSFCGATVHQCLSQCNSFGSGQTKIWRQFLVAQTEGDGLYLLV
jgi:hypothetical protein